MADGHVRRWLPLIALFAATMVLLVLGESLDGRLTAEQLPGSSVGLPVFSPSPGVYRLSIRVTLRPTQPRGQIVYTIDGTPPTAEVGLLYEHPLRLDVTSPRVVVIRAVEVVDGVAGPTVSATYVMGVQSSLPIVSLSADPADLWDTDRGIFANTWGRGDDWERPVDVTYMMSDGTQGFTMPAGLRIHGSEPANAVKQSLRLYFRSEYNASRLEFQLFAAHPQQPDNAQSYKRLLLQGGDRSGRWTLFRDQLVVDVATEMGLHAAQGRFVHLFLNGESWGLYRLSERIDRFFLETNLGISDADLVQDGRPCEGVDDEWDALVDWVEAHDLTDPANYATLAVQVDLDSLTDWAVLHLYFGFPASELYAAHPQGGPWFFLYAGGSQTFASRPDAPLFQETNADFTILLRALLKNPDYRTRFARRLTTLLNTTLAAPALQSRAQVLAATLCDDIGYEAARWPPPFLWEDNVDAFLTDFIVNRPEWVLAHIAEALAVGEVAAVHVEVQPQEAGYVYMEGFRLPVDSGLWEGHILSGAPVEFTAVPARGFRFEGWTSETDGVTPSPSSNVTMTVNGPRHIVARFASLPAGETALRPDDVAINELWINDTGTSYASVSDRPIEGDWIELLVQREGTDLRGWRLTDNDTKTGTAEGSLIFPYIDALVTVPRNTVILILATESDRNAHYFPEDDLDPRDRRLLFYVGNGTLDVMTDPGFGLGTGDDNLALLAPGPTSTFDDDIGIDFVTEGLVTPYTFGILTDGVTFDRPFRKLGADDGALFVGTGGNNTLEDWIVDPPAPQSGDELRADSPNIVTPGTRNPQQRFPLLQKR